MDDDGSTVEKEDVRLGVGVVSDVVAISSSSTARSAIFDNEFKDAVPAKSNAAAN